MKQEFPYQKIHRHLVLPLADGVYVLDTGSPVSLLPVEGLEIAGVGYFSPVRDFIYDITKKFVSLKELGELIGYPIDGLLGGDFFQQFDILVDSRAGLLTIFSGEESCLLEEADCWTVELIYNVPVLGNFLQIGGKSGKFFLDTGAFINYLDVSFAGDLPKEYVRKDEDFFPMIGPFKVDIYQCLTVYKEKTAFSLEFAVFPVKLQVMMNLLEKFMKTGISGVIGNSIFDYSAVYISLKKQAVFVKWYN